MKGGDGFWGWSVRPGVMQDLEMMHGRGLERGGEDGLEPGRGGGLGMAMGETLGTVDGCCAGRGGQICLGTCGDMGFWAGGVWGFWFRGEGDVEDGEMVCQELAESRSEGEEDFWA